MGLWVGWPPTGRSTGPWGCRSSRSSRSSSRSRSRSSREQQDQQRGQENAEEASRGGAELSGGCWCCWICCWALLCCCYCCYCYCCYCCYCYCCYYCCYYCYCCHCSSCGVWQRRRVQAESALLLLLWWAEHGQGRAEQSRAQGRAVPRASALPAWNGEWARQLGELAPLVGPRDAVAGWGGVDLWTNLLSRSQHALLRGLAGTLPMQTWPRATRSRLGLLYPCVQTDAPTVQQAVGMEGKSPR